jgi:hypothetical protein
MSRRKGIVSYPRGATYTVDGTVYSVGTQLYAVGIYLVITQGSKTLSQSTSTPIKVAKFMKQLGTLKEEGKISTVVFGAQISVVDREGLYEEHIEPWEKPEDFLSSIIISSRIDGAKFDPRPSKKVFRLYDYDWHVHRNTSNTGYVVSEHTRGVAVDGIPKETESLAMKSAAKTLKFHGRERVQENLKRLPIINK